MNNSSFVTKAINSTFVIGCVLVILGALGIFTGLFDLQIILWRIYVGVISIAFGALSLITYVLLRAIEPITRASEAYLETLEAGNEE